MTQIPDEAVQSALEYYSEGGCMGLDSYERKEVAKSMLEAALPHLPLGFEVKNIKDMISRESDTSYKANTMFGQYRFWKSTLDGKWCWALDALNFAHGFAEKEELVLAAAQADFDRRILSCVVTKPVAVPTKEERHANTARNLIINQTSTDLENIIYGHDPEQSILNNDVWDRLDKMACEIEALSKPLAVSAVRRQAFEEAATLIDEGFEKEVGKPWRNDGKPSKNDRCPHDKFMYEDCENCASAAIRSISAEPAQG